MITQAFMRCKAKKRKKSRHFTMVLLDEIQWVHISSDLQEVFISEKKQKEHFTMYN